MPRLPQNIWVAAADGDLPRVQILIEDQSFSPNQPDDNTYTPMHAAASYAQLHVLQYLISKGGDVNIVDGDGDTPLYTVENIETARFLVENGAVIGRQNNDGISPIEHLKEEFPDVARYLQSLITVTQQPISEQPPAQPSQHQQEIVSEQLTTQLMDSVQEIIQRTEVEGRDPDQELRDAISKTVLDGVAKGHDMTAGECADAAQDNLQPKKQRLDEGTS